MHFSQLGYTCNKGIAKPLTCRLAVDLLFVRNKIRFLVSCCYNCPVSLPCVAMGWYVVCDYGISRSYSLTFSCAETYIIKFMANLPVQSIDIG